MLEKLKRTISSKGLTVEEYLNSQWPAGKWKIENEFITYEVKYQHLNLIYKWKVNGDTFETVGGKSAELTPQYNTRLQAINEKKKLQDPKKLKIFEQVQKYEKDGFETKQAISNVAKDTGLSEEEVLNIYDKISRAIYL